MVAEIIVKKSNVKEIGDEKRYEMDGDGRDMISKFLVISRNGQGVWCVNSFLLTIFMIFVYALFMPSIDDRSF